MKVTILCVGKIKEKFYKDALAEYAKRLLAYCSLDVIEVADERTAEGEEARILVSHRIYHRRILRTFTAGYSAGG